MLENNDNDNVNTEARVDTAVNDTEVVEAEAMILNFDVVPSLTSYFPKGEAMLKQCFRRLKERMLNLIMNFFKLFNFNK